MWVGGWRRIPEARHARQAPRATRGRSPRRRPPSGPACEPSVAPTTTARSRPAPSATIGPSEGTSESWTTTSPAVVRSSAWARAGPRSAVLTSVATAPSRHRASQVTTKSAPLGRSDGHQLAARDAQLGQARSQRVDAARRSRRRSGRRRRSGGTPGRAPPGPGRRGARRWSATTGGRGSGVGRSSGRVLLSSPRDEPAFAVDRAQHPWRGRRPDRGAEPAGAPERHEPPAHRRRDERLRPGQRRRRDTGPSSSPARAARSAPATTARTTPNRRARPRPATSSRPSSGPRRPSSSGPSRSSAPSTAGPSAAGSSGRSTATSRSGPRAPAVLPRGVAEHLRHRRRDVVAAGAGRPQPGPGDAVPRRPVRRRGPARARCGLAGRARRAAARPKRTRWPPASPLCRRWRRGR